MSSIEKEAIALSEGRDSDVGFAVTSVLNENQLALIDRNAAFDDRTLGALGYKQEFKRDFTIIESFSIAFSCLGLLPSIASTMVFSLGYTGTAGLLWGWVIGGPFIITVALSLAELCSSIPTTGGLYYASAVLAPEGWGPFAAWITGWSSLFGWITAPCSINYALASMLTAAGAIAHPSYTPQTWHVYLILLGLLVLQGIITMQPTKFLGQVNKFGMIANVVIILIFVIWFPVGSINSPKTNSNDIWTTFENGTEWPLGWATIMGFLTILWTMAGYDVPFHMSEECSNANLAGPRAIVYSSCLGLVGGWAIILVIAYTVKDVSSVVSSNLGQPFGALCLQVLGPKAGLGMFCLNMIAQFFVGQGIVIIATRIAFAYSRDGALPGSRYFSRVNKRTRTPVLATCGVLTLSALLGLLMFAGPVAIGAVFSIGAIAQYITFSIPIGLNLFFGGNGRFKPGPWNLGRMSKPIATVAVAWTFLIVPALCFPAVKGANLTLQTMNWTCLIYGGPMLIISIYWLVDARKWFKGPRINLEHILDRGVTLSEGESEKSNRI